jgi:hypothetical protein
VITLFAVAWFVSGLVCLADLLDRRRERHRKPVAPTRIVVSSNVVPLLRRDGVKVLPKRWGA